MLKRIFFLAVFLGLSSSAWAQLTCTYNGGVPIAPDQTTVQTAVTAASNGDVICLEPNVSPVTYTTVIDITAGATKCLSIQGAGSFVSQGSAGQTQIYMNSAFGAFKGWEVSNTSCSISNIRFTVNNSSALMDFGIINWNTVGASNARPWFVHHNDFFITNTCNNGIRLMYVAAHGGIIYRNKFTTEVLTTPPCNGINTGMEAVKHSIGDSGSWWASANTMGTADTTGFNNLYVENNYFSGFNVAVDRHTSSRMVWRFNEMHAASIVDHGFDSSNQGERHTEVYNNTWYCDVVINLNLYSSYRGGTGRVFGNTYPAYDPMFCDYGGDSPAAPALQLSQFKLLQCEEILGWPGLYSPTYPVSHQTGWGWINALNQTVGASTTQNDPGGAGFQQALEPMYIANNTYSTASMTLVQASGGNSCYAMAYSAQGKATGTTLTSTAYVNAGQDALVVFADLVGGTAPAIADSIDGTAWTALQGGTNGSMRLSAWTKHIATTGRMTVTITFDSSSAARAGTLVTMRQLDASPLDKNPAVVTDNTSQYTAPSSGVLSQTNELVLGYFALNGPTLFSGGSTVTDAVDAVSPDTPARAGNSGSTYGIIGTTGGTAASNVTVAVTQRNVTATTAVQPALRDTTANRDGIAGTVTFKYASNTVTPGLSVTDFIVSDREYYNQASGVQTNPTTPFNGTTGTGWGTRANRPTTCTTGVAYWATDQGSWNLSGSGGQGVLDKCTATNTWTDAWYVPYDYPYPGTVTGPTPGNGGTITTSSVATTTLTLNWTAASGTGTIEYYGCRSASAITTVAACLAATQLFDYTPGITSFDVTGLTAMTGYHFNLIARDDNGVALYTDKSQTTLCGPTKVVFTSQPVSANIGATLGSVVLEVQNAALVLCTDSSASVTVAKTSGATWNALTGTLTQNAVAGVVTFSNLAVSPTPGIGTITATSSGLTDAVSNSITISGVGGGTSFGVGRLRGRR